MGNEAYGRHLYYYFATSERNPLEDLVTIWIDGGPGCAGISALVQLIGEKIMPLLFDFYFLNFL